MSSGWYLEILGRQKYMVYPKSKNVLSVGTITVHPRQHLQLRHQYSPLAKTSWESGSP